MHYIRINLCNTFNIKSSREKIPSFYSRVECAESVSVVDLVMFIKVVRPSEPLATDLTAVRFDA